jgi:hypothetical protein
MYLQQHFTAAELSLQQLQLPHVDKLLALLPVARRVMQGAQLAAVAVGGLGPLSTDPAVQPFPLSGAVQYHTISYVQCTWQQQQQQKQRLQWQQRHH